MTHAAHSDGSLKELDFRASDGLEVALLCQADDERLIVVGVDTKLGVAVRRHPSEPHHRGVPDQISEVVRDRPDGRRDGHSRREYRACLLAHYSQKAMMGTPMIVVLCVWVLTPNVMRLPVAGRFGVRTRVSWNT